MPAENPFSAMLLKPFVTAIGETFESMCHTPVKLRRGFNRTEPFPAGDGVSGIIGLAGRRCGSVTLHVPSLTACATIARMTGMEFPAISSDVADGIGELTNIIAGRAKCILIEEGLNFSISLPKVVYGGDYGFTQDSKAPCLAMEFTSDVGLLWVDVSLIEPIPA
jgi:chemotaxis protein CheX